MMRAAVSVRQVGVGLLMLLFVALEADATHWQNESARLSRCLSRLGPEKELKIQDRKDCDKQTNQWVDVSGWILANKLTDWLILAAILLQARIYWRQADIMTGQLKQARRQARATLRQIKLARAEFNATHRPKLRVRLFRLLDPAGGQPVVAEFAIVNWGETPAYLRSMGVSMTVRTAGPKETGPVTLASPFAADQKIAAGAQYFVELGRDAAITQDWFAFGDGWSVILQGTIVYWDNSKIERRTGFHRIFIENKTGKPEGDSFRKVEGSEYEYED